jgi:hypothetical protein
MISRAKASPKPLIRGRCAVSRLGPIPEGLPMLMDRAYEGDETRQLVLTALAWSP